MSYDKYVYPGTNVLRNKFGIMDSFKLEDVSHQLTMVCAAEIMSEGIIGRFDTKHLQSIHRRLFGDIYDWAGEFRDIQIYKGGTEFVAPDKISDRLNSLCSNIRENNYFIGQDSQRLASSLAETMGELNLIHPFREGNGRTQRLFMEQLALNAGYDLDFSKISDNNMRDASRAANRGDCRLMRYLISSNMTKLDGVSPVVTQDKSKSKRRLFDFGFLRGEKENDNEFDI